MTEEDILGIVRHVLTTAGGALTAEGVLSSAQVHDGIGAVMVLAGIVWSLVSRAARQRRALAAAAAGSK